MSQIIFERYIYGGILFLDGVDPVGVFNVTIAAELLNFQELVDYLQTHLIEKEAKWMEEHFSSIHHSIFRYDSFIKLYGNYVKIS